MAIYQFLNTIRILKIEATYTIQLLPKIQRHVNKIGAGVFSEFTGTKTKCNFIRSADICFEDLNGLYSKTRELDAQPYCEAI